MSEDSSSETPTIYGTAEDFLDLFEELVVEELTTSGFFDFTANCMWALDRLLQKDSSQYINGLSVVSYLLHDFFEQRGLGEEPPFLSNEEVDPEEETSIDRDFIWACINDFQINFVTFFDQIYRACRLHAELPVVLFVDFLAMHGLWDDTNGLILPSMRASWVERRAKFSSVPQENKRESEALESERGIKKRRQEGEDADALDNKAQSDPQDDIISAFQDKLKTVKVRGKLFLSLDTGPESEDESLKEDDEDMKSVNEMLVLCLEREGQKDTFKRHKSYRGENWQSKGKFTQTATRLQETNSILDDKAFELKKLRRQAHGTTNLLEHI